MRSEDELRAILVDGAEPSSRPIVIADYDPDWPRLFEAHAESIRAALGGGALMVEHAGSTSVPGLAAKPIIDIVLVVADSADEAAYVPQLEAAGYILRIREPDWFEHRALRGLDAGANVHVFSPGCPEIDRMLLFRDWLRTNASDRELYEQTKRELAQREWQFTQHYADAKSEVVEQILSRATARIGALRR